MGEMSNEFDSSAILKEQQLGLDNRSDVVRTSLICTPLCNLCTLQVAFQGPRNSYQAALEFGPASVPQTTLPKLVPCDQGD